MCELRRKLDEGCAPRAQDARECAAAAAGAAADGGLIRAAAALPGAAAGAAADDAAGGIAAGALPMPPRLFCLFSLALRSAFSPSLVHLLFQQQSAALHTAAC